LSDEFADEVALMTGTEALPRDNGTLVFTAPWEGRALALALALVERLGVPWDEFRRRLIASIAQDPDRSYYESWTAAVERLVLDYRLASPAELDAAMPAERPVL
jgi:nitrile hydratase accessory protein